MTSNVSEDLVNEIKVYLRKNDTPSKRMKHGRQNEEWISERRRGRRDKPRHYAHGRTLINSSGRGGVVRCVGGERVWWWSLRVSGGDAWCGGSLISNADNTTTPSAPSSKEKYKQNEITLFCVDTNTLYDDNWSSLSSRRIVIITSANDSLLQDAGHFPAHTISFCLLSVPLRIFLSLNSISVCLGCHPATPTVHLLPFLHLTWPPHVHVFHCLVVPVYTFLACSLINTVLCSFIMFPPFLFRHAQYFVLIVLHQTCHIYEFSKLFIPMCRTTLFFLERYT